MKLTCIFMFVMKNRSSLNFISLNLIKKQGFELEFRFLKIKHEEHASRVFLIFFKFKQSNPLSTRVLTHSTQMRVWLSGPWLALKAFCHASHPMVMGSKPSKTILFYKLVIFSCFFIKLQQFF